MVIINRVPAQPAPQPPPQQHTAAPPALRQINVNSAVAAVRQQIATAAPSPGPSVVTASPSGSAGLYICGV